MADLRAQLLLCVLTDRRLQRGRSDEAVVAGALAGGATCIQLRAKGWPDREMVVVGRALRRLTQDAGALLIVNDRPDVARAVDADGVHLGVDDVPVADARRLLGRDAVIGFSPETWDQARQAIAEGASYLGVGPVYASGTKPDAGPPIGLEGLRRYTRRSPVPVVAIGGITPENAAACLAAGAAGVAVVSAVVAAPDPAAAARALRQALAAGAPPAERAAEP